MFKRRVDGNAEPEVLWKTGAHTHVTDWSPDGATIVLEVVHPERRSDLLLLSAGGGTPAPLLASPFSEQAARVSPDGRWVAYQSNESGTIEIYLESFPVPGRKVQVSTEGGVQPVWSRDGRELYFRSSTHLNAASVSGGTSLVVGQPRRLFRDVYLRPQGDGHTTYDVFPDGSFVFINVLKDADAIVPSFVAVFNWFEELKSSSK